MLLKSIYHDQPLDFFVFTGLGLSLALASNTFPQLLVFVFLISKLSSGVLLLSLPIYLSPSVLHCLYIYFLLSLCFFLSIQVYIFLAMYFFLSLFIFLSIHLFFSLYFILPIVISFYPIVYFFLLFYLF